MLRECLAAIEDGITSKYSWKWMRGGYDIQWQLFNSKDWGVPQNRERVYTIGHLRRCGRREIFPIESTDGKDSVHNIAHRKSYRQNMQVFSPDGITETLNTGGGGGRGAYTAVKIDKIGKIDSTFNSGSEILGCGGGEHNNHVKRL
jgi:site-specific DNA-cytosine methylase